jgi:hypothetical protein
MRRVFGPRTVVEAAFLIAVPVAAAAFGAGMWTIIAASAVAYLLIFVLEATLWREGMPAQLSRLRLPARSVRVQRPDEPTPPVAAAVEAIVAVQPVAPQPSAAPSQVQAQVEAPVEAPAEAPPAAPPVDHPDPVPVARHEPHEHVRMVPRTPAELLEAPPAVPEAVPDPGPDPGPEPVPDRAPLVAVPDSEPEPERAPAPVAAAPEPEPEPQTVVPIGVSAMPRQWNLWDLERLTRESAGADAARDEERQFLLMYLREFADSAGLLPIDFDGLVRDSFGELVGTR